MLLSCAAQRPNGNLLYKRLEATEKKLALFFVSILRFKTAASLNRLLCMDPLNRTGLIGAGTLSTLPFLRSLTLLSICKRCCGWTIYCFVSDMT